MDQLDLCSCKRGFFTLRDCANPAVATCGVCSRRICAEHLTDGDVCAECRAKRDEQSAMDPALGAVGYRTRWYERRSYQPMWWGTNDPYYYDMGYRWYDDPSYNDDDDGGGFGDS
jgi:hypothetical protein